jgi:hypothetical protein
VPLLVRKAASSSGDRGATTRVLPSKTAIWAISLHLLDRTVGTASISKAQAYRTRFPLMIKSTSNVLFGEYSNVSAAGGRVSWAEALTSAQSNSSILVHYKSWVDGAYLGLGAI